MTRDKRLLAAIVLFVVVGLLCYVDLTITIDHLSAWKSGDWATFGERYSVDVSQVLSGNCYDCWPTRPHQWTLIWVPLFFIALALTIFCWWKPKS